MVSVSVRALPSIALAGFRHIGPYDQVSPVFEKAVALTAVQGLWWPESQGAMLRHDNPAVVAPADLRADCGIVIPVDRQPRAPLERVAVEAGDYAVAEFIGPYERLSTAYHQLFDEWLPASDWQAREGVPVVEYYVTNPRTTPGEEQRTEIRIPVEKKTL